MSYIENLILTAVSFSNSIKCLTFTFAFIQIESSLVGIPESGNDRQRISITSATNSFEKIAIANSREIRHYTHRDKAGRFGLHLFMKHLMEQCFRGKRGKGCARYWADGMP